MSIRSRDETITVRFLVKKYIRSISNMFHIYKLEELINPPRPFLKKQFLKK